MSESPSTPPGWTRATLGVLLDRLQYGYTAKAKPDSDGPRLLRITDIERGEIDWDTVPGCDIGKSDLEKYRLADGDIVFARTGSIEKAGRIKQPPVSVFASYLIRGRPIMRDLSEWLEWFVRSSDYVQKAEAASAGIGRSNINAKNLAQLSLSVAPLPEQHRIVAAIDSYISRLDDAVTNLKRVQANLMRYRASVLKAAVEGRLVPTEAELAKAENRDYEPASVLLERILVERRRRWEEAELAKMKAKGKEPKNDKWKAKYKEPVAPDTEGLPELPEGWCWATLPSLGELDRGRSRHRPRNEPRLMGGPYPFIQTGDVKHADGIITDHSATYSEFGLAQSRLWPAGTLCITIAANIAQTAILGFDACFPDSIVGFSSPERPGLTRFVEFFMRTAREDLDRYAPATAQKNINLKVLSEVAIPVPPGSEQLRISEAIEAYMSVAGHLEQTVKSSISRVDRLRQSVLKWAFEGKLVDQNPTDEPASSLLERIKAEREAASVKTKSRPKTTRKRKAKA